MAKKLTPEQLKKLDLELKRIYKILEFKPPPEFDGILDLSFPIQDGHIKGNVWTNLRSKFGVDKSQ